MIDIFPYSRNLSPSLRFKIILCVMVACILTASWATSDVLICFDLDNHPFMYEDNGILKGLYPEIVKEAFHRMKEPATLRALPWKRVIEFADTGQWGVGGIYMNEKRILKYDYSEPIFEDTIKVYVLREKQFKFSAVPDMTGKTVGVMRGWSYGNSFDRAVADGKIITTEAKDDRTNIRLLLLGRLDALFMTTDTWAMLQALDPEKKICELPTPMIANKTYLAFPKSMSKATLLTKFNAEIRAMRKEGVIHRIVQSYPR